MEVIVDNVIQFNNQPKRTDVEVPRLEKVNMGMNRVSFAERLARGRDCNQRRKTRASDKKFVDLLKELAEEYGVTEHVIRNDAYLAQGVDRLLLTFPELEGEIAANNPGIWVKVRKGLVALNQKGNGAARTFLEKDVEKRKNARGYRRLPTTISTDARAQRAMEMLEASIAALGEYAGPEHYLEIAKARRALSKVSRDILDKERKEA